MSELAVEEIGQGETFEVAFPEAGKLLDHITGKSVAVTLEEPLLQETGKRFHEPGPFAKEQIKGVKYRERRVGDQAVLPVFRRKTKALHHDLLRIAKAILVFRAENKEPGA